MQPQDRTTYDSNAGASYTGAPGSSLEGAGGGMTPGVAAPEALNQPAVYGGDTSGPPGGASFWSLKRLGLAILGVVVVAGLAVALLHRPKPAATVASGNFNTVNLALQQFQAKASAGTPIVAVNGQLQANDALVLAPSSQPKNAARGQLYYDQTTNQLAYYNGTQFVGVGGTTLQSTINNTGSTFNTTQQTVVNNSTTTINGSTNGVTTLGGTSGTIALFTGSQTIGDSIITQNGSTAVVNGNINLASNTAGAPMTIWPANATPFYPNYTSDTAAVEVGIKFQSDVDGVVSAIRFYKGPLNTGTHVGNLWTSTGTNLASVTFTNESASGWQEAQLSTPVAITAATTYIVSYHMDAGQYASDPHYFSANGYDNPPLHALEDGADGGDGVYKYGATSVFPNKQDSNGTNYWVDVVFTPSSNPGKYEINGAQITSTALANNFDIAKRSSGQVFTGINTFRNAVDSGAGFVIQNAGSVPLLTADTAASEIIISKLVVATDIIVDGHLVTNGIAPGATAGAAACTGGNAVAVGADTAGLLTITSGTGCSGATGKLGSLVFNAPYAAAPRVLLTPANAAAAALTVYVDDSTISTAGFDVQLASGTVSNATAYKWYYQVVQ